MPATASTLSVLVNTTNDTLTGKNHLSMIAHGARFISGEWMGYAAKQVGQVELIKDYSDKLSHKIESGFVYISEIALTAYVRRTIKNQLMDATTKISTNTVSLIAEQLFNSVPQLQPMTKSIPVVSSLLGDLGSACLEPSVQKLTDKLMDILGPLLCKPLAKTSGQTINAWMSSSLQTYVGNQVQTSIFLLLANQFDSPEAENIRVFFHSASKIDSINVIASIFFIMLVYHTLAYCFEHSLNAKVMENTIDRLSAHLIASCPNDTKIPDHLYKFAIKSAIATVLLKTNIDPEYINLAIDTARLANNHVITPSQGHA